MSWILDQHQLERGLCDREVGVARTSFGGLDAKQFGVEGDRRVDIVDIEGLIEPATSEPPGET